MQLKVLIFCGFLVFVISSTSHRYEDGAGSNYVMIGNSKDAYKSEAEDKTYRTGFLPSYPLVLHNRPSSDNYHGGLLGFNGGVAPNINQQSSSLISANIHLLEPFLLVTFLLFVLSLVDKARFPPLARNDYIQEAALKNTPDIDSFLKILANRTKNST